MNEPMSAWRTFTSDGLAPGEAPESPRDDRPRERVLGARTLALVFAVLGGCGAGAAVVLAALLLLAPASGDGGLTRAVGQPLADGGAVAESADGLGRLAGDGTSVADGAPIVVDVAGAVVRPGLVRLWDGDRVGDAIAAAGGFAPRVDLAETAISLNLAQALADGAKVVVPELGTQAAPDATEGDARIDLNAADQAALESLPGVGPVTATRIIEAREQEPFRSVEELRTREVVGEALFEDLRDLVRASD